MKYLGTKLMINIVCVGGEGLGGWGVGGSTLIEATSLWLSSIIAFTFPFLHLKWWFYHLNLYKIGFYDERIIKKNITEM